MAKNFDDILKKGKDKVKVVPSKNKKELFKEYIVGLLGMVHSLNELYENGQHNLAITNSICNKCKKPSFILTVKNIDNMQQSIRFHKASWKAMGQGIYLCDACKKGN